MAEEQSSIICTRSEESASQQYGIRICFNSQDGSRTYYKCDQHTKLKTLIRAFCKKAQIEYETTVFLFEGKPLPYVGTVAQAGLIDQDEIDAMMIQIGGGGARSE